MNHIYKKKNLNGFITAFLILAIVFLISPNLIYSQITKVKKGKAPDPSLHHEVMEDDYVPILRKDQEKSPAFKYTMSGIVTTQVNVDENGQNIVGDAANEPSIAVDPNDPNRMAIGWRQFNTISSNFRQAGWGYTIDGGQTWTFPGVIEPGIFRSDPVLDSDADGNFYYNSLTNTPDYYCDVFKSSDGGLVWDGGTYAQGGDKQWMTIDKTGGLGNGNIYAFWTYAYSVCDPGYFTRSTNAGGSFEDCLTIPNDPYWGTLATGPNGELYIGGTIGFNFQVAKSVNAQNSGQIVNWDMATTVDLDGTIANGYGPNPGGLLGQASIAVDNSGGPNHENVYLLCSVERNSNTDPLDIMFVRSTDGGITFSNPVKINDDPGITAYQWFGTMSVAPNGRIDVIWLDTRDNLGTNLSALYYSTSTDGGTSWSANERLSGYFDPHVGWPQQNKMGDYFDMVSDNNGANLAWAATFNGEQDVYYSYITPDNNVPVELSSFSYSILGSEVILDWSTATELNNHGFEIQRSLDKKNWATLGFIEGKGTISEPHQYSFSDNISDLSALKLYYKLKQIDFNGSFEYSDILEVEVAPTSFALEQNYPNPFNPSTVINYQLPVAGNVTLKIFNVLGKEVATLINQFKETGNHSTFYIVNSTLPSGIYYYQLKAGDYVATKKMVLMK